MFRTRRLYRPVLLLAMAMGCCVMGYMLVLHQDASSVHSLMNIPENIHNFQEYQRVHEKDALHIDSSNNDKIEQIASLLGVDVNLNHEADVSNKILQIELLLDKFRTQGDDKQAGNVLKEIQSVLQFSSNDRTNNNITSVNKTVAVEEKVSAESILENIENLLEQPVVPPPPIPKVKLDIKPYIKEPNFKPSICSKTVTKYAEKSAWFKSRHIPDIKIFMDKYDVNNFTNYYKLSHYGLPFGIKGVDRKVLAQVLNNPNFTNPNLFPNTRPNCVRCAVVGCGGVLNGSNAGEEIDGHDFVFRLNRALTKGKFGKDTGVRTSFYTFFPESQYTKEVQDQTNAKFIYVNFKKYDVDYANNMLRGVKSPPMISYARNKTWYPPKPLLNVQNL
uniref:alpha-N-acetylgalactosaminide alpha-2,6-sialyltransferase n=1 Tax=Saccoglossus kowalevskii TaxID=10224 RepID=A0ABM0M2H1_SACKO|nr:PREDICTED: uncharacterized protein LOC102808553 [Saccoglossus kowalevskii]